MKQYSTSNYSAIVKKSALRVQALHLTQISDEEFYARRCELIIRFSRINRKISYF